jgi:ribonuclease PH
MGFTKFFYSLNPFSTTRRRKRKTRRHKKQKRTRRNIMRGG